MCNPSSSSASFFAWYQIKRRRRERDKLPKKNVKLVFHPFRHAVNASFFFCDPAVE